MEYAKAVLVDTTIYEKGEHHLFDKDILLSQDFVVSSNQSEYEIKLENNQLVFIQNGIYLNQNQKMVSMPVQILREYAKNRQALQYLGLEFLVIGLLFVKRPKRRYRY